MTTLPTPAVGSGRCEASGCVKATVYVGPHLAEPVIRVESTETGTTFQARASEWATFIAEIKAGDWDHIMTDLEFAIARQAAEKMAFVPESITTV